MNNLELEQKINTFADLKKQKEKIEAEMGLLNSAIKKEFDNRNTTTFDTASNLRCTVVLSERVAYDEENLIKYLKETGKAYLVREAVIMDAFKAEVKNKIINESVVAPMAHKTIVKSLNVNTIKD